MELQIEHLKKSFDDKDVLKDITFTFQPGKIYGLLGRNGAGKTTLFNCLNQDISVDAGRFFLRDKDSEQPLGMEDIGYVLSTPQVPEFLTAREFLKFFVEINAASILNTMDLDAYFDLVNLEKEDRDRLLKDFSHGMKNKMQMLVNIIASPKVLLLDEPLTSLDVVVAEEMKNILRDLKKDRILILSTHIMELAFDLCDEIVLLSHGKLEEMPEKESEAELKADILRILQEEDHA
ncbi:ABC transporter ATP-binding protein [Faecalicoccus pleomorphus]|uniref:ABC transporter ATP-binding protein n=1 Tax=Faecalicoccus pleomorphus TaxID=1323 RepID=A0A7X9NJ98_9FIRM|nr:ABC transporter ATP-binding protein [Faecalicoccus pleomorphus]NME45333.1 ABC transporter ATP-binding protein [Faecalicoccus pleomorphus]